MTDAEFLALLACPIHRRPLTATDERLTCPEGCDYPRFGEVPFLLPRAIAHTHRGIAAESFATAETLAATDRSPSLEHSDRHPRESGGPDLLDSRLRGNDEFREKIDPFVQKMIGHTNSNLYHHLAGQLRHYPIPDFPMIPEKPGARLLDIGAGWGRWSIGAARRGFDAIGIDPSLDAALAATRVARRLGADKARFVVADARYMPFRDGVFDAAFSYSVLQHFSKEDVAATLAALARVMRPGGISKLHLLNRWGLRSLEVQLRRAFRPAEEFETRYWSPAEMRAVFGQALGPSRLELDGFFVQGRYEDRALFKPQHRALVEASRLLVRAADYIPVLGALADNLFVISRREDRRGV
jgi:SAM-dependent methyltransferase